jgi:signal transduction histidine kinase
VRTGTWDVVNEQAGVRPMQASSDELLELRRCMRELVALTGLPALWVGRPVRTIAESLADALFGALRVDLVYVSLDLPWEGRRIEVARTESWEHEDSRARDVGQALGPWLDSAAARFVVSISNPLGEGTVQLAVTPIGYAQVYGLVAAASQRPDFPTEHDRLLLRVAANTAVIALGAQSREHEAMALYEVVRLVPTSVHELEPLLGLILDQLKAVVDYRAAAVFGLEGDDRVVLDYRGPLPREQALGFRSPLAEEPELQEVLRGGEPWIATAVGTITGRPLFTPGGLPILPELVGRPCSLLCAPFVSKGETTGYIALLHATPGYFTARHARLATAFAQQAAVALENARLYKEERAKAALEERQRLARELHDSVSQILYVIGLNAITAEALRESEPARLGAVLGDVLALARAGLAEMRALIFELRPESLQQEGLVAALEKQTAAVRARYGMEVEAALPEEPDVPLEIKEALYRIAQEALQNAARHAQPRAVRLSLEADSEHLVLRVSDDGTGFDPAQPFPGHLGLRSMRERATTVGGTLELESTPGAGTRVQARVPAVAPP